MLNHELNEDNFILVLMNHYDNPGCSGVQEFYDDIKRFKYLRRLFNKYETQGELRERLIINHLVVLNNLFGVEVTTRALAYKIDRTSFKYLKPFMMYLNMDVSLIDEEELDQNIIDVLRKI